MDGLGYDPSHFATHPAPQIFTGYYPDGNPSFPGPIFSDLSDPNIDDTDPKRRRIARACDMCRKKKIKCDGKMPKCSHCINYKTDCVFTQVEKKRNPPKGAKYIEGLENRLDRMETLLKMSGVLSDEEAGKTDLGTLEKRLAEKTASTGAPLTREDSKTGPSTSRTGSQSAETPMTTPQRDDKSTPPESVSSPNTDANKDKSDSVENLSDMMCSLMTNSVGETRYIGSASALSIFSKKGIEWVNEKTGDTSFQETIMNAVSDDNKWMYWKPEIFSDLFFRPVFKPLPPEDEAMSLLKDYFENFNCMFPLFHEPTFMHLVKRQYSSQPYEGSGWWASMNVALAISHRLRVMSHLVPQDEDQKAWMYLKNAMGVLTELTMRNTDLLSVQALLGMALFLQGTPNPQPSFFLIAAAIRLSHSIGLHKRGSGFNLNPIEAEQRKRVFWIAFMLDKDTCLRSGRPPVQDDDDMNVELPSEDPPDNIGNIPLADGKGKTNLFRLMCRFAIISSKVYRQLYSVRASKQTDGELLNTIGELDKELEEWKESIPLDFRPDHVIKASHTPLVLHIVVLHFCYYNCLTTIHRMSIHHGYWTSRLSDYAIQGLNARPLNPRVYSSATHCVLAARNSIDLIKYIPQGDFACVWLILYFPVSALVTLFANILQNPQDPRAHADLKQIHVVVNFLSSLVTDEENGSIRRMLGVCAEFERIATVVLDKAERESSRRKRKVSVDEANKAQQPSSQAQVPKGARHPTPPRSASFSGSRTADRLTPSLPPHVEESVSPGIYTGTTGGTPQSQQQAHLTPQLDPGQTFAAGMGSFDPDFADVNSSSFQQQQQQATMPSTTIGSPMSSMAFGGGSFQQPFVPQDLWQMPMTFEWDWADMNNAVTGGMWPNEQISNEQIYGGMGDGMPP